MFLWGFLWWFFWYICSSLPRSQMLILWRHCSAIFPFCLTKCESELGFIYLNQIGHLPEARCHLLDAGSPEIKKNTASDIFSLASGKIGHSTIRWPPDAGKDCRTFFIRTTHNLRARTGNMSNFSTRRKQNSTKCYLPEVLQTSSFPASFNWHLPSAKWQYYVQFYVIQY